MSSEGSLYQDGTILLVQLGLRRVWHKASAMRAEFTRVALERATHNPARRRGNVTLDGQEAWNSVVAFEQTLETMALRLANVLPASQWLWYLRRITGLFEFNETATTVPYCESLAEALTSLSTKSLHGISLDRGLSFPCDDSQMRRVVQLRTVVGLLYENHSVLRWAGKGCPIRFSREDLPLPVPPTDLEAAVELFDERGESAGMSPLATVGLAEPIGMTLNPDIDSGCSLLVPLELPERTKIPVPPEISFDADMVLGRYVLSPFDLRKIEFLRDLELPAALRWPAAGVAATILLCACNHPWFLEFGLVNTFVQGYYLVGRQRLVNMLDWTLRGLKERQLGGLLPTEVLPASGEAVLNLLLASESSIWPPQRLSSVRRLSNAVLVVDLLGARDLFFRSLTRPNQGGREVNTWALEFERHVQRLINETPCRPSDRLLELRGRTLRFEGTQITDVDAIATSGRRLILVSCKSTPYASAYDRGEYSAVRNLVDNATRAQEDWRLKLDRLRAHPSGDNYDFNGFELYGVVVYPFVVFVRLEEAVRMELPDLRSISSVDEFWRWCGSKHG